jgi:formate-dependent phosphoribosylglycinamide formyltransferase (GAR transformylase)
MKLQNIAAAMNIAYAVVRVDEFADEEANVLAAEIKSFNMDDDQRARLVEAYKEMSIIQAIAIISNADQADKREAEALTVVALLGDGELSDKEIGAYTLMASILGFEGIKYEEARQILGF